MMRPTADGGGGRDRRQEVEVEVEVKVKRGLGIGKRVLCWCLVGVVYAGVLQSLLGGHLQKEKLSVLRHVSEWGLLFDSAQFSIRPLISKTLKGAWESPLTLYLALLLVEVLTPFPLLKARLLTMAYAILVSYAVVSGTDTPAKLKECNSVGSFDLNADSLKSYPMAGMRIIQLAALAVAIYLFYTVVRVGERFMDWAEPRGRWLMYMLLWGEPLLLPVLFLPDVHVLNFAFSWARNFATHVSKNSPARGEHQMATQFVAFVSAQDDALSGLSLRLPGSSYTQAAGLPATKVWAAANPRCFARINEGLFTFKMVLLALFVYGLVNKILWAACKRLTSMIF